MFLSRFMPCPAPCSTHTPRSHPTLIRSHTQHAFIHYITIRFYINVLYHTIHACIIYILYMYNVQRTTYHAMLKVFFFLLVFFCFVFCLFVWFGVFFCGMEWWLWIGLDSYFVLSFSLFFFYFNFIFGKKINFFFFWEFMNLGFNGFFDLFVVCG